MTTVKIIIFTSMVMFNLISPKVQAGDFSEGFEIINQLPSSGWTFDNQSDFIGDLSWSQGSASLFTAQAGPDDSYLLGGVGQTGGDVLCDWLVLPDVGFVEQLNFYTRTVPNSFSPDRLVVVYSASGGTNTGPCVINDVAKAAGGGSEFGDFVPLLSINPDLAANTYPSEWTQFNVPVNGDGRLALVYFVDNVGQNPFNGNLIAIDSINIGPGIPPVIVGVATPVPGLSQFGILVLLLLMIIVVTKRTGKTRL